MRAKDALIEQRERDAAFKQTLIDKLWPEAAVRKRMKFAATSEKFAGSAEQKSLLLDTLNEDLAELGREIKRLGVDGDVPDEQAGRKTSKRQLLPPDMPREEEVEFAEPEEGAEISDDYATIGLSLRRHPLALIRHQLAAWRVQATEALRSKARDRQKARASCIVTPRLRPSTARVGSRDFR